jgi:hypothetical protein
MKGPARNHLTTLLAADRHHDVPAITGSKGFGRLGYRDFGHQRIESVGGSGKLCQPQQPDEQRGAMHRTHF